MKKLAIVALSGFLFCPAEAATFPLYETTPDYLAKRVSGTEFIGLEEDLPERTHTAATSASDAAGPDVVVTFTSATTWLSGAYGSVSNSFRIPSAIFTGSSLDDSEIVPIQIVFSSTDSTLCHTYRRDLGYVACGVGLFPGTAWDMSDTANPRRPDAIFHLGGSQAQNEKVSHEIE